MTEQRVDAARGIFSKAGRRKEACEGEDYEKGIFFFRQAYTCFP